MVFVVFKAKFYNWDQRGLGSQWCMVLRNLLCYLTQNNYPWKYTHKQQKMDSAGCIDIFLYTYNCLYIKQSKKREKEIWEELKWGNMGRSEGKKGGSNFILIKNAFKETKFYLEKYK